MVIICIKRGAMVAPYNKLIQNKKCVLDIRVSNKAKKSRR
jgi:hypothetical protein